LAPRFRSAATRSLVVNAGASVVMTISPETSEEAMRNLHVGSDDSRVDDPLVGTQERNREGLPNRLLTAFEVASFIGCHEETVRRAYWRGLLRSQRFGVRGRRFHPGDVLDWLSRGAPTKSS
jgi:excisionase family DNA binding protein